MLQLKNVSKEFSSQKKALDNINFVLKKNEMVFLTGHSGAGKSTLLKLIAGVTKVSSGEILFDNTNINSLKNKEKCLFRRKLGLIFQNPNLINTKNVFQNVALPLIISGIEYRDLNRKVRAALDKVSLLNKEKSMPFELSSGEQQRVSIARAIVNKPNLLLADEPTGNLDPKLSMEIINLFRRLQQVGVSVIIASHDLHLFSHLPYKKLNLQNGVLINA